MLKILQCVYAKLASTEMFESRSWNYRIPSTLAENQFIVLSLSLSLSLSFHLFSIFTEQSIDNLVEYYKSKFPQFTFTPKFHILYKHVIRFIQQTGVGLGRMAEQGGEQLHKEFNMLERRLQGVKNVAKGDAEQQLLLTMMEEHHLRVNPTIRKLSSEE